MKFFAVLSLTAVVTQGARLTHKETVEASQLIQAVEQLAEAQQMADHEK